MSNSSLVTKTLLSPNCNSPRNNKILKITPHHTAGFGTTDDYLNMFANPSREASANYIIGSDHTIGLCVDEANRAWTSGSPENDNMAITIEVANDGGAPDWHVSDENVELLIQLMVDICKRNGIASLNYTGGKGGNLTLHKMFQATSCPGPYLESKMPAIAKEVNKRLGVAPAPTPQPTPTPQPVSNDVNIYYRVKTLKHGWLPEVKNLEDYAGWEGSPIVDVAIRVDRGSVWYQAHVLGGGWLGKVTGCDLNDFNNGYAGDDRNPIDALTIYYQTPQDIINASGYKRVKYRSNYGWQFDNETSNGQDGYVGVFGNPMTELRAVIE